MPTLPELVIILAVIVVAVGVHRIKTLGDALGGLFRRSDDDKSERGGKPPAAGDRRSEKQ